MQLTAMAIGTRMPGWVESGTATYLKRLPRHLQLSFREFAPAQRSTGSTVERQKATEADRLLKAIPHPGLCIALDEHGKSWTSMELAKRLEGWQVEYSQVSFLIGGADGLDKRCLERADFVWSLSPLTLPHALVRIVLAEQIYRAWTLIQGHPYHRD